MTRDACSVPTDHSARSITLLQEELAQTNREVLMLTLELEHRLDDLRVAEERYRRLAENAPDIIYRYEIRPCRRFTFVNSRAEAMTGYSAEEHYSDPDLYLNIVHYDDYDLLKSILSGQCPDDKVTTMRWSHKNGSTLWIEQRHVAVHDQSGDMIAVECVARDITERYQLEAQFRQSQKMEAIGRLAGGVAHDFNNLLTIINGYSECVLSDLDESAPGHVEILEIKKAGDRAAGLTRQLLAFSRQQVLQPQALDLNEVVADMEKMLRRVLGEDVELRSIPGPDIKRIYADRGQIEQILMNLVVNARDAMPSGGHLLIETATVDLDETYVYRDRSVEPGQYVMLAVSDTGHGMDETTLGRIFEPFFTTKPKGHGTGLGLSTVFGIIKQSGGTIFVYSEVGKGTTFKIYLPLHEGIAAANEESHISSKASTGSEVVLVVEDEPGIRKLICASLRKAGYRPFEAENGREALVIAESHGESIDLLITDVVMPEMSGRDLTTRLAQSHPGIRVLYMSGFTDNAVMQHGIISPELAFLQKPFTPSTLMRKAREVLDAR